MRHLIVAFNYDEGYRKIVVVGKTKSKRMAERMYRHFKAYYKILTIESQPL